MRPRQQYLFRNTRSLVFFYALLCALTALFTQIFFRETLHEGGGLGTLSMIVFFSTPAVLLVLLGVSVANLIRDIAARRPGIKFRVRLLMYFAGTVVLAAIPMAIVTSISIGEIVRFWHGFDSVAARDASRTMAVENFSFHMERFENAVRGANWNAIASGSPLPDEVASVQDFVLTDAGWLTVSFRGGEGGRLDSPPSTTAGFPVRELPRDAGFFRYVMLPGANLVRLASYDLGTGFDSGIAAIETQAERLEVVDSLRDDVRFLGLFYYGVFFIPPMLMTMMIAISFTRRLTGPIAELTAATRRVAAGDFSVSVFARQKDELGTLVRSFNSMVQDLETSRAALVKAEKISLWQNMAQQLAHEIKNPLTPIRLSAERVLRRWRNEPEQVGAIIEDSMMAIIQETDGLSTLLNEFRTFAKPMEPSNSFVGIGEVVPEVIGSYRNSFPGIAFDASGADGGIVVKIGKNHFLRVLTNLVINAIDAMGGDGHLDIRTDLVHKKGALYCRTSVRDSGAGIPKEDAPQIFTPYFSTKKSGTGLGLPIVERIVTDYGGSIWFDSGEGMGTVFFVDLPAVDGEGGDNG